MEYRDSQVDIFLKENGFREVNAPRPGLCLCGQERIYPIHLAAVKGNHQVLPLGKFLFLHVHLSDV